MTRPFAPTTSLTSLLVHLIYVFHRDIVFLNELAKVTKVFADGGFVKSLGTFGVKTGRPSKLDLQMSFEKALDPFFTRLCSTESLSLHSN